ncbi:unnamed protein product [Sphenostylis stenocarpa]|uniref:Rhodanese domain-containing protein n=1 Tax=Sphenostylis stenocarpa TaxID=92480 RepID=A0AA86VDC6_9FABA|nr:unnamed protein product [Sphenostylis stenocarpa]
MKPMTTATTATIDVSAACFRVPPSCSPRFSPNPCNTRFSVLNSMNPQRGRISVNVPPKFPSFRREVALKGNLEAVVPTSVPVRVAYELLLAGHRYLDVRTPEEFDEGHPPGAINIPYMLRHGSGMTQNSNFIREVSSHFRKDDEIIVVSAYLLKTLVESLRRMLLLGLLLNSDVDLWFHRGVSLVKDLSWLQLIC